jgi:hypothetical protein
MVMEENFKVMLGQTLNKSVQNFVILGSHILVNYLILCLFVCLSVFSPLIPFENKKFKIIKESTRIIYFHNFLLILHATNEIQHMVYYSSIQLCSTKRGEIRKEGG